MPRRHERKALVVFAREPKPGRVKTRLQKHLPTGEVLALYKSFVVKTLKIARQVDCEEKFLFYAGHPAHIPFLKKFQQSFTLKRQCAGDLGARMHDAFYLCSQKGFTMTVGIGTDCLEITKEDLQKAFGKLASHDAVFGPAKDGGYYLIGLRVPIDAIFSDMRWGSGRVMSETVKRIKRLRKKIYFLEEKNDIDTIEDLKQSRYILKG